MTAEPNISLQQPIAPRYEPEHDDELEFGDDYPTEGERRTRSSRTDDIVTFTVGERDRETWSSKPKVDVVEVATLKDRIHELEQQAKASEMIRESIDVAHGAQLTDRDAAIARLRAEVGRLEQQLSAEQTKVVSLTFDAAAAREVARDALNREKALSDNLSATQARCTALREDNQACKAVEAIAMRSEHTHEPDIWAAVNVLARLAHQRKCESAPTFANVALAFGCLSAVHDKPQAGDAALSLAATAMAFFREGR